MELGAAQLHFHPAFFLVLNKLSLYDYLYIHNSSSRHLPEAAPAITSTRLSTRDAASAILWKFQQAPKTRLGYFSLLRHSIWPLGSLNYFLDGPLTPAALFLFSAQLFPANRSYTATVRLPPHQYTHKHTKL